MTIRDERGESLLEVLVAVAILGIAVVGIMAGITTGILMSDVHRKQAIAASSVRTYGEAVEHFVAGTGYTPCAGTSAYKPVALGGPVEFTAPAGYTVSATAAATWSGTAWVPCATDNGVQKITLKVSSSDNRATERLDVILRKPCRTGDGACT